MLWSITGLRPNILRLVGLLTRLSNGVTLPGQSIEFTQTPVQIKPPFQPKWSQVEAKFIVSEILSLLGKGVIQQAKHENGEFILSVFLRHKKDGSYRIFESIRSLPPF